LRGPFAAVGPEARALWLDHVRETQPLAAAAALAPALLVMMAITLAAGLIAAAWRAAQERTGEAMLMTVVMLALVPAALWQVKFTPYASFFAALILGVTVASWQGSGSLTPLSVRLLGIIGLNQLSISLAAALGLQALGTSPELVNGKPNADTDVCMTNAAIQPLSKLEPGLVFADIDLGPFIVALTPHDAFIAPYHRMAPAIGPSLRIWRDTPEAAQRFIAGTNARYVVACMPKDAKTKQPMLPDGTTKDSFFGQLTHDKQLPFLSEVLNVSPEPALRVWRVIKP
jgi:hypothetical protein